MRRLVLGAIIFGICVPLAVLTQLNDIRVDMNSETETIASDQQEQYSDEPFLELVEKYAIDDGDRLDYAAWQSSPEDVAALRRQVALIGRISPESHPELFPTRAAERRYWINAYNALVVDAVLEHWPLDSVRDVRLSLTSRLVPGKGFFWDRDVVVGGEKTNLLKLEWQLLRSQKDPRLHFALNCASGSCPALRPSDWSDEELNRAAREFVNDPANVSVEGETVHLSRIFKWYKKDFPKNLFGYLAEYAEPNLAAALEQAAEQSYRKTYRDYDWSLNAASHSNEDSDAV